jgi:hypothetical protein
VQTFLHQDPAVEQTFRSDGLSVSIRVPAACWDELVPPYLPPSWKRSRAQRVDLVYSITGPRRTSHAEQGLYRLYRRGALVLSSTDVLDILDTLESELHFETAVHARRSLFIHAGVVGWRGRAILIPGPSMSGKSSLVAALVRAGADYYSDEFALLDAKGNVHPYARRLSLRTADGRRNHKTTAEALGGRTGRSALPVGLILITEYREAAVWNPKRLTQGEAVLATLANTVLAREQPARTLQILRALAEHADTVRTERGEARDAVEDVLRLARDSRADDHLV